MVEKSNVTAIIALLVSIGTAGFSGFQWWNSERESRISAAIDISKNHAHEIDDATWRLVVGVYNGKTALSPDEGVKLARHGDVIEYIALLANTGRLDKGYLSPTVQCDIAFTNAALERLKHAAMPPSQRPEMAKLSAQLNCPLPRPN